MSFTGLQPSSGPILIGPGQSVGLTFWFGNPGNDRHAQWAMAHPLKGQPPTTLMVSNFTKSLDYGIKWLNSEGDSGFETNSAYYRYGVTVTNLGNQAVFFNIQGGGNT